MWLSLRVSAARTKGESSFVSVLPAAEKSAARSPLASPHFLLSFSIDSRGDPILLF